ncbi:MAG: 3-5 exonuclease protein 2 [Myxococcales bacterium]|nr:3-5 exonuclease protein 2 [Myxococcales bacterium]
MSTIDSLPRSITKEAIAALPIRGYDGEVNLVTTAAELARSMADLRAEGVLGFDTETRPSFRKGEHHLPCLIQLATARRVHLFQLARVDCAAAAAELLDSPAIVKTGVGMKYDLGQLKLVFPFAEAAVVDLGGVAKRHGFEQSGVRTLAGLFLGVRIAKGARTSNWSAPKLTAQQIGYAATDAWACRALYLRFADLGMLP